MTYVIALVTSVLVLLLDMVSKIQVMNNFELYETRVFIEGLLNFSYIQNPGAAWGAFAGSTAFLIIVTALVMILCIYFLVRSFKKDPLFFWAISLVLSGGVGNLLDRIFRDGFVVDFLQFGFWTSFPVFNIADCAVVIGAGLLILYYILDLIKEFKIKKSAKLEENNE